MPCMGVSFVATLATFEEKGVVAMKLTRAISSMFAAVMLGGLMLFAPAFAAPQNDSSFSALQGVEAQALSVEELQAISGELNALDIAAALTTLAVNLGKYPRLQAATVKLADYYKTNFIAINAAFEKFGVLTPCKSCP